MKRVKVAVVPSFYVLGVNFEDLEYLPKPRFVIQEKCNCYELYGDVKHVNGGNYHAEIRVYEVPGTDYYIFVYGNTREYFIGDQYEEMIVLISDKPKYGFLLRDDESVAVYNRKKAERVIKSYKEDENYYVIDYREYD